MMNSALDKDINEVLLSRDELESASGKYPPELPRIIAAKRY